MIVVFFAGKARVGKTTAANLMLKFAKKNDMSPVILPFAKAIKDEAERHGLSKELNPEGYRTFCQDIGASRRAEDPDYWIKQFNQELIKLQEKDNEMMNDPTRLWRETVVIVDDCRYLNELEYGRKIGAQLIFISSGGRQLSDNDAEWRNHESEVVANTFDSLTDCENMFDWIIKNGQSQKAFEQKLKDRFPIILNLTPHMFIDRCDCPECDSFCKDKPSNFFDFFGDFSDEN